MVSYKFKYLNEANSTDISFLKKVNREEIGILAQTAKRHFPATVSKTTNDAETLFVDYAALNVHLIEALQKLKIENDKLDKRFQAALHNFQSLTSKL